MDDVRGRVLGLPHGTTPDAVTTNENIKMSYLLEQSKHSKEIGWARQIYDETMKRAHGFKYQHCEPDLNKTLVKPWRVQPKTIIKL